jgi:tetratricopeptide (TPR) repeat protein
MDVSPEHLVGQARERFQLQDYYGAIHLLEEVVATGRAFADAHHLLGLSYTLVGQSDQALAQLDRALTLNPQYVEALVHRAIVLNELGREAEADAAFRRAAQVGGEPRQGFASHVAAKLANQHAHLGDAYLEAGGLGRAIEQYNAALALGPAFHDLRYKLGRMLLEAGRALDAREHFEIIVRARPTYLDAAAMLGLACYLAGDGLAAKAVWEDCRERRPEDPRVEAYLAMLARNDTAVSMAMSGAASPRPDRGRGDGFGQEQRRPNRDQRKSPSSPHEVPFPSASSCSACGGDAASCTSCERHWLRRRGRPRSG